MGASHAAKGQIRTYNVAGSKDHAGSSYRLLVSHMLWDCLLRCWEERIFLPLLAHRFWKLTLQLLSRYSTFVTEVLNKAPTDVSKDPVKPLHSSASSTSSRTSQEDTGSEIGIPTALSAKQLVNITADVHHLQEQIPEFGDMIKNRLELIGFTNFQVVSDSLADSKASLSPCIPALDSRVTQLYSERCFRYLKSASEVPRLYRRTNKEVPTRASPYMDNALRPLQQLQSDHKDTLKGSIIQNWLRITLCDCTQRYYETVSDVLSSVKKMEESLKRLKQARKTTASVTTGTNGGPTDDGKIRIQLALDVEFLGDQIQKMGLQTGDITLFSSLLELVHGARDRVSSQ